MPKDGYSPPPPFPTPPEPSPPPPPSPSPPAAGRRLTEQARRRLGDAPPPEVDNRIHYDMRLEDDPSYEDNFDSIEDYDTFADDALHATIPSEEEMIQMEMKANAVFYENDV